jgi:hypothetical protein
VTVKLTISSTTHTTAFALMTNEFHTTIILESLENDFHLIVRPVERAPPFIFDTLSNWRCQYVNLPVARDKYKHSHNMMSCSSHQNCRRKLLSKEPSSVPKSAPDSTECARLVSILKRSARYLNTRDFLHLSSTNRKLRHALNDIAGARARDCCADLTSVKCRSISSEPTPRIRPVNSTKYTTRITLRAVRWPQY